MTTMNHMSVIACMLLLSGSVLVNGDPASSLNDTKETNGLVSAEGSADSQLDVNYQPAQLTSFRSLAGEAAGDTEQPSTKKTTSQPPSHTIPTSSDKPVTTTSSSTPPTSTDTTSSATTTITTIATTNSSTVTPTPTPTPTTPTPTPTTPTTHSITSTEKPTSSTPSPTKAPPPTTTIAPEPGRQFDGPSFIGGIVFAFGVTAIGFLAWKFYKARTERNYHTL